MRHLLNDLPQVVLEGGRVQLLIVTAQGLSRVVCPLKPHELLPAHYVRDKKKDGGEVLGMGWVGIQEDLGELATFHPQQETEQLPRPGPLVDGHWAGLRFLKRHFYPISLPFASFTF